MRAVDTFSNETQQQFRGSSLWKPWMQQRRLRQIASLQEMVEFLEGGDSFSRIALDFETNDLSQTPESVCGICLGFTDREGVYIPIKHVNFPQQNLDPESVWDLLLPAIKDRQVVVYNWKFEGNILRRRGFHKPCDLKNIQDAMIYRWLFDSDQNQINLKDAAQDLIGCEMLHIQEVPHIKIGKKKNQINFALSDPGEATLYAAADPIFTLAVLDHCKPTVDKEQPFIVMMEHTLLKTLFKMEDNPVTIDRAFLQQAKKDLERWSKRVAQLAWDRSGEVFNLDSPKEVARVLEKMGVSLPRTEKDNPETSAKALTPLIKQYPIIDDILFYRSLVKERTTYVEPLLNCTSEKKSTVVFKFTAPGAPTGRFSSGGVDEGDPCYAPMNVQAIISSAGYRLARCRKVSIPGVSAYD